jgi:hypothetical protein
MEEVTSTILAQKEQIIALYAVVPGFQASKALKM